MAQQLQSHAQSTVSLVTIKPLGQVPAFPGTKEGCFSKQRVWRILKSPFSDPIQSPFSLPGVVSSGPQGLVIENLSGISRVGQGSSKSALNKAGEWRDFKRGSEGGAGEQTQRSVPINYQQINECQSEPQKGYTAVPLPREGWVPEENPSLGRVGGAVGLTSQ